MITNLCSIGRLLAACAGLCAISCVLAAEPTPESTRNWLPLGNDELHDPSIAAHKILHDPGEALSKLSPDGFGNQVDWVKSLDNGDIKPRNGIHTNTGVKVLNLDVLRRNTGEMNIVLFPHKQHTELMACSICHEGIFKSKAGATKFGMFDILNGEYCGRCHGAVAFPLTECNRCHSVPREPIVIPGNQN